MPWPLLKWIMYTSSSSSSSSSSTSDDEDDFDDAKDEGTRSKKGNNRRRDPQKQREQNHDEDSDEDDFSYEPQEEETSNDTSDTTFTINEPHRKRRRIDNLETSPIVSFKRRKRVWSKQDELELLRNFLDYRTRPRTVNETPLFYNEVNPKLKLQFTKRRLAEKLGRLKKKYKNAVHKMVNDKGQEFRFRNPHDRMVFDISHRIWADGSPIYNVQEKNVVVDSHDVGSSKTLFDGKHNNGDDEGNNDVRGMIIELATNPIPLSLSNYGGRGGDVADEKWKEQQILELEAYSKRLELAQQQVKAALDDLRSK